MFQQIKKLWAFLRYFLLARNKAWCRPRQSEVLIFDAAGQEVLMEYLAAWNPEVLHLRGEQINVWILFSSLFRPGRKFDAYVDAFIEEVRPRLIITFVDNSLAFYALSTRHPDIKTFLIQNGYRGYYGDIFESLSGRGADLPRFKVDFMMNFGSRIGAEYTKYIQGITKPMGSLKNNKFLKRRTKDPSTIVFISQFRDIPGTMVGGTYFTQQVFFKQVDQIVLAFLLKYTKKHEKRLVIVPCSAHYKDGTLQKEQAYFNTLLEHRFEFSEWDWSGSGYDATDSAEIVVSVDSTLAYESAVRGNRTAFFTIRSALVGVPAMTYGWPEAYPDEGPYWTNLPDTVVFERIMDHLLSITDEQWLEELSANRFAEIMAYDPGNTILRSTLATVLGESAQSQPLP